MADEQLSALPAGAAVGDSDLFYSAQGGAPVRQPASALATYVSSKIAVGLPPPLYVVGGNLGIGTETNPMAPFVVSFNTSTGIATDYATLPGVYAIGKDATLIGWNAVGYGGAPQYNLMRADGTAAAPAATSAASTLGAISFNGWAGAAWEQGARVRSVAQGLWSGSNWGASLEFSVTPTGATTPVIAARMLSGVIIGNASNDPGPNRTLHVPSTVSALPAAASTLAGAEGCVTDATSVSIGSTVVGGGSNTVKVFCTGASWIISAAASVVGTAARLTFGGTNATYTPPNPNKYWVLPFSTVDFNVGGAWNPTGSKFTPPAGAKLVQLTGQALIVSGANDTTGNIVLKWIKNTGVDGSGFQTTGGTELQAGIGVDAPVTGSTGSGVAQATCFDVPSPGDYYQLFIFVDSTALGSTLVTIDGQHAHTFANMVVVA